MDRLGGRLTFWLLLLVFAVSMHGATQTLHAETPADTLVIGMSTAILLTLDPAEAYEVEALVLIDQLYDKLVELEMVGDQIEVVPEVAALLVGLNRWTHLDVSHP